MNGDGWVEEKSVDGGWIVVCRLCGKDFRRSFQATNTDYANAAAASADYLAEHQASAAHRAAVCAYHADLTPLTKERVRQERLLSEIFGTQPPSETERRREAARGAARRAARDEGRQARGERKP